MDGNLVDALTNYVSLPFTPNSGFDRHLRGEVEALTAEETEGYALFRSNGCVSCRRGRNLGVNFSQAFGLAGERGAYMTQRGTAQQADLGRFMVSGDEADRFVFRVPSLRNVTLTGPYMHDVSAVALEEAAAIMLRYHLGQEPPARDPRLIVEFLGALANEQPASPTGLVKPQ